MSVSSASDLRAAADRLNPLRLYPEPVDISRVRVVYAPWFFRVPGFRRYRGYTLWRTILVRTDPSPDLLCHELCHVWQVQHRPLATFTAWLFCSYRRNPFEREARAAVTATREVKA